MRFVRMGPRVAMLRCGTPTPIGVGALAPVGVGAAFPIGLFAAAAFLLRGLAEGNDAAHDGKPRYGRRQIATQITS